MQTTTVNGIYMKPNQEDVGILFNYQYALNYKWNLTSLVLKVYLSGSNDLNLAPGWEKLFSLAIMTCKDIIHM